MDFYQNDINWGFGASMEAAKNKDKIEELEAKIAVLENQQGELWDKQETMPTVNGEHHQAKETPIYDARILHRDISVDWAIFPYALANVVRFCEKHGDHADTTMFIRSLQLSFTSDDPPMMIIAITLDEKLIGHVLCERVLMYFKPMITVHQYMLDQSIPPKTRQSIIELLKQWGRYTGPKKDREPAKEIQWLARNKQLAKMYQRFFGAKSHMLVMKLDVEDE